MENTTENDGVDVDSIIALQRCEIEDAKTLNSDLDLALRLQMQEAINASLSSHSPPQNDAVLALPLNDAGFDYTALLPEDLERHDQERKDREVSENLMKEMREDLDRRIHDQKLAAEIMNIPEDSWREYGDNYHKPYNSELRAGGGGMSVNSENFKVYCKGVESEEMIRDKRVIVGGVGVAICDSRDNVIFEVSKGLEVVVGGGGGGKGKAVAVAVAVAEIVAIVEGLNAALSLDLKKVTFMFDDFMVHQYVTGRAQANQGKILDLVNEVSFLQKKFADCKLSLVARNDIKFAFKLARDAIVSQITWPPEEVDKGKKILKETCLICYEYTDTNDMFSVDGCLHRYCFSCMKQHVEVKLLNGMEAKCPHEGCKSKVSIETCGKFLDPKLVEIMSQRKREASISVSEKVYCPYQRCSALMSKSEVLEFTKTSFVGAETSGARRCVKCCCYFCINCRVPWHYNLTCYDYKSANPYPPTEDAMLDTLAKRKLWRQCVKCSHMVELAEGCYHITCRCGYEFCYTCGAQWKNKKATCSCPIWDERNIIRDGRRPR